MTPTHVLAAVAITATATVAACAAIYAAIVIPWADRNEWTTS